MGQTTGLYANGRRVLVAGSLCLLAGALVALVPSFRSEAPLSILATQSVQHTRRPALDSVQAELTMPVARRPVALRAVEAERTMTTKTSPDRRSQQLGAVKANATDHVIPQMRHNCTDLGKHCCLAQAPLECCCVLSRWGKHPEDEPARSSRHLGVQGALFQNQAGVETSFARAGHGSVKVVKPKHVTATMIEAAARAQMDALKAFELDTTTSLVKAADRSQKAGSPRSNQARMNLMHVAQERTFAAGTGGPQSEPPSKPAGVAENSKPLEPGAAGARQRAESKQIADAGRDGKGVTEGLLHQLHVSARRQKHRSSSFTHQNVLPPITNGSNSALRKDLLQEAHSPESRQVAKRVSMSDDSILAMATAQVRADSKLAHDRDAMITEGGVEFGTAKEHSLIAKPKTAVTKNHGTRKGMSDARASKAVTSHIFAEQAPSDASARAWKPPTVAFANLKSINVDIENLIPSQRRSQDSSGGLDKL